MARKRYIEYTEITVGSECDQSEIKEKVHIKPKFGGFFGYHTWELCALHQIQGTVPPGTPLPYTYPLPSTSNMPGTSTPVPSGTMVGAFTFWGNPLFIFNPIWPGGIFSIPGNPLYNSNYPWYNYFYDWVVQEVGPVGVGDKIEFDVSMQQAAWWPSSLPGGTHPASTSCTSSLTGGLYLGSTNKICLIYKGISPTVTSVYMVNNMTASVTFYGCDCKYFGLDGDTGIAGWDCVSNNNIYEANLMGSPDKCVPRFYPVTGAPPQFATKLDCTNSGCGKPPTTIPQPIGVGP